MGWSGQENGELLASAAAADFGALLTKDANFEYQQDVANLPIPVVVLRAPTNAIHDIRPLLPQLLSALNTLSPNQLTVIPQGE